MIYTSCIWFQKLIQSSAATHKFFFYKDNNAILSVRGVHFSVYYGSDTEHIDGNIFHNNGIQYSQWYPLKNKHISVNTFLTNTKSNDGHEWS